MNRIFFIANGELDVARLRLDFDDISSDATYVTNVGKAILTWQTRLPVSITNLNLTHDAAGSDYVIRAGNGKKAHEPNKTLETSYVGPDGGYLFYADGPDAATHEFGHLLGLADRYYEGYLYDSDADIEGERSAVPMSASLFPNDTGYDPSTNIMSSNQRAGGPWTISSEQIATIQDGTNESPLPRHVVGIFNSSPGTDKSITQPVTMYLDGGGLYTREPTPNVVILPSEKAIEIAGYEIAGPVLTPRDRHTKLKTYALNLWQHRKRKNEDGTPATKIVWRGVLHRGKRTKATGPRIHQKRMSLIGKLAG